MNTIDGLEAAMYQNDISWSPAMTSAYQEGVKDGKEDNKPDVTKAKGFDACYIQGWKHGYRSRP